MECLLKKYWEVSVNLEFKKKVWNLMKLIFNNLVNVVKINIT